ncbi:endonuclease MutS2 [Sulfuricurvum sp.]|jgi:DNA mismatch repair protein MutS2|uniref:endonuclease MutS2 n=1 Tax=Sulfuricurvum sp. TaxID=2025608 RepID=UPI00345AD8FE
MSSNLAELFGKLDLLPHLSALEKFFSRHQNIAIPGDQERHFRYIQALDALEFKAPPKSLAFEGIINHLKKQGVLRFEEMFEVIKVVRYFRLMRNNDYPGIIGEWMGTIRIPEIFDEIDEYFDESGKFIESRDEELHRIAQRIKAIKTEINESMKRLLFTQKLAPYLVDSQIHYINDEECLLLRGGFNHVFKGSVIGRTGAGFFYVAPDAILRSKEQLRGILQEREAKLYEYAKKFSMKLAPLLPFIGFIDREFERYDHYQARVLFARAQNYAILKPQNNNEIILEEFSHPALHKPKPISVRFKGNLLMITGVNAGGKTMLLKSILSAAAMAKYLIPMKLNPHKSRIGGFKRLVAVIDDPQNVSNDISTFAGRMVQFSHLFDHKNALVGVDEIELGTDSDEAAALFAVVLDELIKRGQKIIVTTHHKRLAALMADRDDVELLAALYDEERRVPTYEFLHGVIGKSYAFETAARYGINPSIISRAKVVYGENHEKLNILIERGSELERELKRKNKEVDERLESLKTQERELKEARENLRNELEAEKSKLRYGYDAAIREAKEAAKGMDMAAIHRQLNKAASMVPKNQPPKIAEPEPIVFTVGQSVKYRTQRGTIVSLGNKDAMIEVEGMRIRVKLTDLKPSGNLPKKPKTTHTMQVEQKSGLKLDLHGLRGEEACERMDKFLSDALLQGFDEVIIYHGIGTGKLSYAVKEFLKVHPSVKGFSDAPQHLGGFGAKIVRL